MLSPQNDKNEVITETLQELITDRKEADTLLLLHAKHASVFPSIIIEISDTDVFLLCLDQQNELRADLYVATSRSSCLISVRSVAEKCEPAVPSTLLSLHAFTGCDSTSCFKGKGKIKPFELMKETEEFEHTFRFLGCNSNLTNLFQQFEKFVCCIL